MNPLVSNSLISAGGGIAAGGLNALYSGVLQRQQIELEKDWWYAQQKFLEEHNSPAYQMALRRKAGLNPFTDVSNHALGNVNSELPRRPNELFSVSDITDLMNSFSQMALSDAQVNKLYGEAGLIDEQTATESQRRNNLVQEYMLGEIAYRLGLMDEETREIKLNEFREAWENGNYTPTSDAHRAAVDTHNQSVAETEHLKSLSSFYDESVEKLEQEIISLKRENKIGEQYDEVLAQYKSEVARYESNIKAYESKMSDIYEHALKEFGWDLKTIPPVFHPYIIPLVNADLNGSLSDLEFNQAIETMSNWSGHQINNYNKSTNPDYIDAPTKRELNIKAADVDGRNIKRKWDMQMDEAYFDLEIINTIRDLIKLVPRDKKKTTTVIHKTER